MLVAEIKRISLEIWNMMKLEPSETWANIKVIQELKQINPPQLVTIRSPNEDDRGGDIEIWVVDRAQLMICFIVQGKRLFKYPSPHILDRYHELNYPQMKHLLTEADNEKNIPLYCLYNTPYQNGYFISKNINNAIDNGWRYSYAHQMYLNYYDWNQNEEDKNDHYRECSQVYKISHPMHELVSNIINFPSVLINTYIEAKKDPTLGRFQNTDLKANDFLKKIPKGLKYYMTEEQIRLHNPHFAFIPKKLLDENTSSPRPVLIIKSSEYF